MKYEAVIFDLDGTLVDSLEDIADSMNTVLAKRDYPVHKLESYRIFIGDGIQNLVYLALPEGNRDEATVQIIHKEMVEEYSNQCLVKTRPYDGILSMLDTVTSLELKMAILSNKAEPLTKFIANQLFAKWRFEEVMGGRPDFPRKPDPSAALEISRKMEVNPDKMMFIGDTSIDIHTAKRAGMLAIGVLWGYRDEKELITAGADYIIRHPSELIPLLHFED